MADPTHGPYGSPILDNFNRADGDPGSNWVTPFIAGTTAMTVDSHHLRETAGGPSSARWAVKASANAECCAYNYDEHGLLVLRSTATLGGAGSHAYVLKRANLVQTLQRWDGASIVDLATGTARYVGGWGAISMIGSSLSAWQWDGTSAWALVVTATDSTYTAPGYIGAQVNHHVDGNLLYAFGGGWTRDQFGDGVNTWKPNEKLELAFGKGPKDTLADADWIPASDLPGGRSRARSFSFARTRSDELERYDSFAANATLTNTDAALSPENTASPYVIKPRTPIRYTVNGVVMYRGYTGGFPQVYPNVMDAVVPINALDRLSLLNRKNFQGATVLAAGLSGQRFIDVLITELGYTLADVDIDPGTVTLAASEDLIGTNPLAHLQDIALAEGGRFFCSRDGRFTFRGRTRFLEQFAAQFGVFGNENDTQIPFRLVNDEITHDETKILNGIYITDSVGGVVSATDAPSIADYDNLDYNVTWPISAADATNRSGQLLHERKDPHLRIPGLEILHSRNPAVCWPVISMLEIGQRFGFRYQPLAVGSDLIAMDVIVDGISITSVPGDFKVVVQLAPADAHQYWLIGVPGYSEIGVTTRVS